MCSLETDRERENEETPHPPQEQYTLCNALSSIWTLGTNECTPGMPTQASGHRTWTMQPLVGSTHPNHPTIGCPPNNFLLTTMNVMDKR